MSDGFTDEDIAKLSLETSSRERLWDSEVALVDPNFRRYRYPVYQFVGGDFLDKRDPYDDDEEMIGGS